nr:hypothetical protein CFP56_41238 [Quercus suber]
MTSTTAAALEQQQQEQNNNTRKDSGLSVSTKSDASSAAASDDAVPKTRDFALGAGETYTKKKKMTTVAIRATLDDPEASVWRRMRVTALIPAFSRTATKG